MFKTLRDENKAKKLKEVLSLTPYSFQEYKDCFRLPIDDIDDARMMICRSFMGFGSDSVFRNNGFKHGFNNNRLDKQNTLLSYLNILPFFTDRLRNVIIENLDFEELIRIYDNKKTLFYVDPPYLKTTLSKYAPEYSHKFETEEQHIKLAKVLIECKGNVVLSGYDSPLYDELYSEWFTTTKRTVTGSGSRRIEKLWIKNPSSIQQQLFKGE